MRDFKKWITGFVVASFLVAGVIIITETEATEVTVQTVKGPYESSVAANALDITFTAGGVTSTTFQITGRELIVFYNTASATPYQLNLTSTADSLGRTGDISAYSLGGGEHAVFKYAITGWASSDNVASCTVEHASVQLAIIRY